MTAYAPQFLRHLQFDRCDRLNKVAWRAACNAGVALRRPTHRGCRGGVHKLRRTPVKQTGINAANLLNIQLTTNVRPAKLCLLNTRSVCNKADFLVDYVADHDLDILCITETWLSSEIRGGGVGVLFKSSFTVDHSQLWHASSFECLDLQLRCHRVSCALRLFVIY